jgi:hypothetical protein
MTNSWMTGECTVLLGTLNSGSFLQQDDLFTQFHSWHNRSHYRRNAHKPFQVLLCRRLCQFQKYISRYCWRWRMTCEPVTSSVAGECVSQSTTVSWLLEFIVNRNWQYVQLPLILKHSETSVWKQHSTHPVLTMTMRQWSVRKQCLQHTLSIQDTDTNQ